VTERGSRSAARSGAGWRVPGGAGLFIVATPIGNLGDVTFRALEVLRAVPLVAAEDTRLTRRLLRPVRDHHSHGELPRPERAGRELRAARAPALRRATWPSSPTRARRVSDPGEELVRAWAAEGGVVVPIPGASAVLAALVAPAASPASALVVRGLPAAQRPGAARAPGPDRRRRAGLRDLRGAVPGPPRPWPTWPAAAGGDRPAAVCRELTKLHEEIVRGTLADLAARAAPARSCSRGEFAIVVEAVMPPRPARALRVRPHRARNDDWQAGAEIAALSGRASRGPRPSAWSPLGRDSTAASCTSRAETSARPPRHYGVNRCWIGVPTVG
jgi:16S rRNA (cytidine1402-2'-O)-methyltransferase